MQHAYIYIYIYVCIYGKKKEPSIVGNSKKLLNLLAVCVDIYMQGQSDQGEAELIK